jgi:hypothetical protein
MEALRDHPKRKIGEQSQAYWVHLLKLNFSDILIIHFIGYIGFFLALGPWTRS